MGPGENLARAGLGMSHDYVHGLPCPTPSLSPLQVSDTVASGPTCHFSPLTWLPPTTGRENDARLIPTSLLQSSLSSPEVSVTQNLTGGEEHRQRPYNPINKLGLSMVHSLKNTRRQTDKHLI